MDEFDTRQVKLSRYRRLLASTSDPITIQTLKALIAEIEAEGSKRPQRPILQAEQEQPNNKTLNPCDD